MYLVAIMDWYSRFVLAWQLSNTLDSGFCLDALEQALQHGQPEIFNTDQGAQFTSQPFTTRLLTAGVCISMDGRGRALDNVFIERLWRSVKYEDIYLKNYDSVLDLNLSTCLLPFLQPRPPPPGSRLSHARRSPLCPAACCSHVLIASSQPCVYRFPEQCRELILLRGRAFSLCPLRPCHSARSLPALPILAEGYVKIYDK